MPKVSLLCLFGFRCYKDGELGTMRGANRDLGDLIASFKGFLHRSRPDVQLGVDILGPKERGNGPQTVRWESGLDCH
jgi:hypothetical protein